MSRHRGALTALAVGSFLLVPLSACGDGDGGGTRATPTSSAGGGATTSAASGATTSAAAGFKELSERQTNAVVKVTYRDPSNGSTVTFAQDPPMSSTRTEGFLSITRDGKTYMCTEIEGEASCFGAGTETPVAGPLDMFGSWDEIARLADMPGVSDAPDREIAGRTARCLVFDPSTVAGAPADATKATVCLDAELGILLLLDTGDNSGIEAIAFGQPTAADFELPATPIGG